MSMSVTNTAMIGSTPGLDAAAAFEILAKFPLGIPTWPQLPKRSFKESMTVQYTEGFPGIVVDEKEKRIWIERDDRLLNDMASFYEAVLAADEKPFGITDAYAAGLHRFFVNLAQGAKRFPLIKGQVVGPLTFGFGLSDNERRAVWFDEQYRDIVVKGIAMKALWQARRLCVYADQVVIFLDEPIFSALGTPAYIGVENEQVVAALDEIAATLHEVNALVGVHCCGNMEWSLLAHAQIDIISFDAYSFGDKVALYSGDIGAFLKRGGRLAWGIVPTDTSEHIAQETGASLCAMVKELETLFVNKGISADLLKKQRLFTPSCGMGNLTGGEALRVLEMLQYVGEHAN
jgi:hypothetical protein